MKRIILFTILAMAFLAPGIVKAQDVIPNGDFENWAPSKKTKGVDSLIGWTTISGTADSLYEVNYLKNGDLIQRPVYDGHYCMSLLNSVGANLVVNPGAIYIKFAWKQQDPFLLMNMAYFQGQTNTANTPYFRVFAWKHDATPVSSDTCLASGFYIPGNSVNHTLSDSIEPWFLLNLPLTYKSTTLPDSGAIIIQNSLITPFDATTELYIEKLWFANTAPTSGIAAQEIGKNSVAVYPNPFNHTTTIHYNLGLGSDVNLAVFDMQGRQISNLVNSHQPAGTHDVTFDGSELKNGIYFYRLQTGTGVETGKLILNK